MLDAQGLTVDADFPGGNIVVEGMDGDCIRLHQDIRDTTEWWFYWQFRVRGAAGRSLAFTFTNGDVFGTRGPAVSGDGGATWRWLGLEACEETTFTYAFEADEDAVRFCFTIPYLASDFHAFLDRYPDHPDLRTGVLCQTSEGRDVEVLYLGARTAPAFRVLLTARHHACESIASYCLEGLMEAVLGDGEGGRWLREHVALMVVPFVDKDGVEDGDQGKSRHPHDHNRDYGTYQNPRAPSLYTVPAALRQQVPGWSKGKLRVALDFHCPWIRGEHNEAIYFVGSPNKDHWAHVTAFASVLEAVQTGPLPYHREDNLPFGEAWNTVDNVAEGRPFSRWAAHLSGVKVASTIEIPYANVDSETVTADKARALGRDVARAIWHYLSTSCS
jgi:hypothetical protein